jgi:hypothetical protein
MENIAVVVGLVVSLLSLFTGIAGAIAWYQGKVRKEYASERDFNHLKNNQKQLAVNVEQLWRLMDEQFREHQEKLSGQHEEILRELVKLQREH